MEASLDTQLFDIVRKKYLGRRGGQPRNWYGRRGGPTKRLWICYVCDEVITSESGLYPITNHAKRSIAEHGKKHRTEGENNDEPRNDTSKTS